MQSLCQTAAANLVNDRTGGNSHDEIFDGVGSVVALTDTNGNIVNSYSYDAQGSVPRS